VVSWVGAMTIERKLPPRRDPVRRRPYWVLLERPAEGARWTIQFGDFEKDVAASELREYRDKGVRAGNLKLILCADSRQATIDADVARLNEGGGCGAV
jgi:hypothetical protein